MAAPTSAVLDNFNRADGAIGSSWTAVDTSEPLATISGNQAASPDSSYHTGGWNATTFGPDCEVYALSITPGTLGLGLFLRCTNLGGTSTVNCYEFYFSGTSLTIFKMPGFGTTPIVSVPYSAAGLYGLWFTAVGPVLTGYTYDGSIWTPRLQVSDSSYTAAGYVGFELGGTGALLDNFGGGSISVPNRSKVFMVTSGADGNFGGLADGTPQTAANRADGWTVAKTAVGNSAEFANGTKQAATAFSSQSTTPKPAAFNTGSGANAFKTPAALSGVFDTSNSWSLNACLRSPTSSTGQTGRIRLRVFKSANANGSSATELTGSTQFGLTSDQIQKTTDVYTALIWTPGSSFTLNNEYLFFVVAWEIMGAASNVNADVVLRTGTSAGGSQIITSGFAVTATPKAGTDTNGAVTESGAVKVPVPASDTNGTVTEGITLKVADIDTNGSMSETSATIQTNQLSGIDANGAETESVTVQKPVVKTQTLVDTFDTTVDTVTNWPNSIGVSWDASGRAALAMTTVNVYSQLGTSSSNPGYDLTGSYYLMKPTPAAVDADREFFIDVQGSSGNKLSMFVSGTSLYGRKTNGGTNTTLGSIPYDPVAHAWWRIRESAGTVYWDVAPNGINWTNLWSVAPGFDVSQVWLDITAGFYSADTATTAYVDNVNAPPTGVSASDTNGSTGETGTMSGKASSSDGNGSTSEAATQTALISTSDANTSTVESGSVRFIAATTDANGTVTESALLGLALVSTDSNIFGETTSAQSQLSSVDNATSVESGSIGNVPVSSSDANGVTSDTGALLSLYTATDANGASTESPSVVAKSTGADANAGFNESANTVGSVSGVDSNGSTAETSNIAIILQVSSSDSGTIGETVSATAQVAATDNGSVVEATSLSTLNQKTDADSGGSVEAATIATLAQTPSDGTAIITESASAGVSISSADSGSGVDAAGLVRVSITDSDLGSMIDIASGGAIVFSLDAGTTAEVSGLGFGTADNAAGFDYESLAGGLNDADYGFMTEAYNRYPPLTIYPPIPAGDILTMAVGEIVNESAIGVVASPSSARGTITIPARGRIAR